MAPNGHKASQRRNGHQSHRSSCQSWLKTKGETEFEEWRADNPTQQLSYEDWKSSKHVAGLSLFFAAADIFNESESSGDDEELQPVEAKPHPRAVRTQSAREPKKKVTTNGDGPSRAASSATPTANSNSDDLSPSSKRQRRAKKLFLSEEIINSESESDRQPTGSMGVIKQAGATPTVLATAVNGKRKSSARKSKKKVLSEEIISPEDELDDRMVLNEVMPPPMASPLPVRSASKVKIQTNATVQTPVQSSEPPKRTHILKLSTRKTPKKPDLPEKNEPLRITETSTPASVNATTAKSSKSAKKSKSVEVNELHKTIEGPSTTANLTATANPQIDADNAPQNETPTQSVELEADSAVNSPNPTDLSASATRRGLRTRRPAQQRPYYHDAQLFDEVEHTNSSPGDPSTVSPELRSRRTSAVSFVGKPYDAELLAHLDAEGLTILQDDAEDEEAGERRPKTFKGKGRAWKKEESDEDEEFTVARKKAAKAARAKAKSQAPTVPKKRGRPRKSAPSEGMVYDESEVLEARSANASPAQSPSPVTIVKEGTKKGRKPSRKSLLSAEIIEDSDSDVDISLNTVSVPDEPSVTSTPKSKKTAKARKSDQSTASRSSACQHDEHEGGELVTSTTPVNTPRKSYTPRGFRDGKSYTPMGMPRSLRLSVSDTVEGAKENVDADVGGTAAVVTVADKPEKNGEEMEEDEVL